MDTWFQDIGFALRSLRRNPGFTAIALATLALGIGANTGIFSVVNAVLLEPLPYADPARLVAVKETRPLAGGTTGQRVNVPVSAGSLFDWRRQAPSLEQVAAVVTLDLTYTGGTEPEQIGAAAVSANFFPMLGVAPMLGRNFQPEEERPNAGGVVLLSHGFWQRRFAGDSSVIGQALTLDSRRLTIIGVLPALFDGAGSAGLTRNAARELWLPLTLVEAGASRAANFLDVFARLKPGVTVERASAEINTIYHAIINDVEAELQRGMSDQTMANFRAKQLILADGRRGQSSLLNEVKTPLILLLTITGLVLLIACANIANLLLARGAGRSQEMAIRGSLGAGRAQLVSQLLLESCLLAVVGGAAGLLVARATLGFIGSIVTAEAARMLVLTLQPRVFAFAGLLSIGTGILFGLYPALHVTRPDLMTVLKASTGQPSGARAAARFRAVLVTGQIGLSMTLLVAAGLFIKSLATASRVDLGLDTDNVVMFELAPVLNGYPVDRFRTLYQSVEDEVAALPGVQGVTSGRVALIAGNNWGNDVNVQGFQRGPDTDANSRFNMIGPAYFSTLGIPLVAGREFTTSDGRESPRVAVVNQAFARKFGLGNDAVGKFMSTGGDSLNIQIVGLVTDAKYSEVKEETPPLFFTPYRQAEGNIGSMTFYARTASEPASLLRAIPAVISRLDPNLPVQDLKTLDRQVEDNLVLDRVIGILSAAFAVLATILAAIGLYGVLAYTVAQRTREIGLRMALGADGPGVRAMVLWQVGRMTIIGGVLGLLAALGIGRAAASLLFEMKGSDPGVMAAVVLLLSAVALAAGFVPALRASQVDPMRALRYE